MKVLSKDRVLMKLDEEKILNTLKGGTTI